MDKHARVNVCVVEEGSPRTREWVLLVDSWVSAFCTSVRISNIDLWYRNHARRHVLHVVSSYLYTCSCPDAECCCGYGNGQTLVARMI
jgi:hypothetical protein